MASFRCYDNSNVIANLIMTNFHLSLMMRSFGMIRIRISDQDHSDQMIVQSWLSNFGGNFSKCLVLWRRSLCSIILGGIDPEKLYRVSSYMYAAQYHLSCCIVWASFLFERFGKTWATCGKFHFWANVYRPPGKKNCPYACAPVCTVVESRLTDTLFKTILTDWFILQWNLVNVLP